MIKRAFFVAGLLSVVAVAWVQADPASDDGGLPAFVEWADVCFPHEMHFSDFEIECAVCHHETNAVELHIPHEEYFEDLWIDCKTCHRNGADFAAPVACSACHHDSPTDIADETLGSKVVLHRSCWTCHSVGTGAEAAAACKTCHTGNHRHPTPLTQEPEPTLAPAHGSAANFRGDGRAAPGMRSSP